jgi:hypothetical protein
MGTGDAVQLAAAGSVGIAKLVATCSPVPGLLPALEIGLCSRLSHATECGAQGRCPQSVQSLYCAKTWWRIGLFTFIPDPSSF